MILLDLSSKFPVLRLRDVMDAYIQDCIANSVTPPPSRAEISSLIRSSLVHLHIFSPESSSSVLATLHSIPSYLLTQPFSHFSAGRRISLVVLNDMDAFLFQDRLEGIDATSVTNEGSNNKLTFLEYYRTLVSTLRSIQCLFSCQIIATGFSLADPIAVAGNHLALRPHLPAVWTNFRTAQIILEKVSPAKFRVGISACEAENERVDLQETWDRSQRVGWVNWWGSEEWKEDIQEAVSRWERNWGGIRFWIGKGVRVQGIGKNGKS